MLALLLLLPYVFLPRAALSVFVRPAAQGEPEFRRPLPEKVYVDLSVLVPAKATSYAGKMDGFTHDPVNAPQLKAGVVGAPESRGSRGGAREISVNEAALSLASREVVQLRAKDEAALRRAIDDAAILRAKDEAALRRAKAAEFRAKKAARHTTHSNNEGNKAPAAVLPVHTPSTLFHKTKLCAPPVKAESGGTSGASRDRKTKPSENETAQLRAKNEALLCRARNEAAMPWNPEATIFHKIKLCDFFHKKIIRGGVVVPCGRGDGCTFAHDGDTKPRPDLSKTKFCLSLLQNGRCADPDSCTFAHSRKELRSVEIRGLETTGPLRREERVLQIFPRDAEVRRDRCVARKDLEEKQVGSSQPDEVVLGGLVLDERRPQTHNIRRTLRALITQTEAGILIFRRVGLLGDS